MATSRDGAAGTAASSRSEGSCECTVEGVCSADGGHGDSGAGVGVGGAGAVGQRHAFAVTFSGTHEDNASVGADASEAGHVNAVASAPAAMMVGAKRPCGVDGDYSSEDGDDDSPRDGHEHEAGLRFAGDGARSRDHRRSDEQTAKDSGEGKAEVTEDHAEDGNGKDPGGPPIVDFTPAAAVAAPEVVGAEEKTASKNRSESAPPPTTAAAATGSLPPVGVHCEPIDLGVPAPPSTVGLGADGQQAQRRPNRTRALSATSATMCSGTAAAGAVGAGIVPGTFLEGQLPWGKRRRMSGMLTRKGAGGGRGAASMRWGWGLA